MNFVRESNAMLASDMLVRGQGICFHIKKNIILNNNYTDGININYK